MSNLQTVYSLQIHRTLNKLYGSTNTKPKVRSTAMINIYTITLLLSLMSLATAGTIQNCQVEYEIDSIPWCMKCHLGYRRDRQFQKENTPNKCLPCEFKNCAQCDDKVCSLCMAGWGNIERRLCVTSEEKCITHDPKDGCIACSNRYYRSFRSYIQSSGGFYAWNYRYFCGPCPSNCAECKSTDKSYTHESNVQCIMCDEGYNLVANEDYFYTTICEKKAGFEDQTLAQNMTSKATIAFKLNKEQQANALAIIEACTAYTTDKKQLSYVLATAYGESKMKPIKEIKDKIGTKIWYMQKKYWSTGFYGRGYVQLTWKENYAKFGNLIGIDLVNNPDDALDPKIASKIICMGMTGGHFSKGNSLSRYLGPDADDWINARRIVNGQFEAGKFADYGKLIFNAK